MESGSTGVATKTKDGSNVKYEYVTSRNRIHFAYLNLITVSFDGLNSDLSVMIEHDYSKLSIIILK